MEKSSRCSVQCVTQGPGSAGFAVVTALLVLVAVGVLAAGAGALSLLNMRLTQNTQMQTIARYNAERGLDIALIALAQMYVQDQAEGATVPVLPDRDDLVALFPADDRYTLVPESYVATEDGGQVAVLGVVRGSDRSVLAQYRASARFAWISVFSDDDDTVVTPGPGWITNGDIFVAGKGFFRLNMHAGGDVEASGTGYSGFSYQAGTEICEINVVAEDDGSGEPPSAEALVCRTEQDGPDISPFDWQTVRDRYPLHGEVRCDDSFDGPTVTQNIVGGVGDPYYVCLPDGADVTFSGTLSNVTIVGGPTTRVTLSGRSEPNPSVVDSDLGVRLVAGDVTLDGDSAMTGRNLIYARGNVRLEKDIEGVTEDAMAGRPLATAVTTSIFAGNDVAMRGSGNWGIVAEIFANRKFCRAGGANADFIGTITVADETIPEYYADASIEGCEDDWEAIRIMGASAAGPPGGGGPPANLGFSARLPDSFGTGDPDDPFVWEREVAQAIQVVDRR